MSIDYGALKGRIAPTTKSLSSLPVPVGSFSVVVEFQTGMYQDGTPTVAGREPPRASATKSIKVLFYPSRDEAIKESAFVLG